MKEKLNKDNLDYLNKIIESDSFEYEKLDENLDIGSKIVMSIIPFFLFLMIQWAMVEKLFYNNDIISSTFVMISFMLLLASSPIIFFSLEEIYLNKKRNKKNQDLIEYNNDILKGFIKDSNTFNTLKALIIELKNINLIYLENKIENTNLSKKQFRILLKRKLEEHKIKRKEYLK